MQPLPVHVTGEIDAATAPALRDKLHDAIDAHPGALIPLDLSELEFLDSAGLGVLIAARRRATSNGGNLVLHAVPASITKLLAITGLGGVFRIAPDDGLPRAHAGSR